ncbi:hypothetical protein KO498_02420 [Lentibacter algarum]|uniref:hypothetical protein n=1 Tax=Lentibacter algarum TaxID=576131 RepID=UPI001C073F2B|nr:hypothetical protein [Lentibacter algarum]MBU2980659.1 hypothetical protein [Lentibacter algarum]
MTETKAKVGPIFVVDKKDGFGERLRALCNAFVLAERYQGTVRFTWHMLGKEVEKFHAIADAKNTFSSAFVASHLINRQECDAYRFTSLKDALAELENGETGGALVVQVNQNPLERQTGGVFAKEELPELYAKAFKRIEFSQNCHNAWEHAMALPVPENFTAIHVRSGDMVYGRYRYGDDFRVKVIPYPIIEHSIVTELERGHDTVLFGQDLPLRTWLTKDNGAIVSESLGGCLGDSAEAQALHDVALMSRAQKIICGNSGLALLASMAGAVEYEQPFHAMNKHLAAEVLVSSIRRDKNTDELHPLVRAFACRYLFFLQKTAIAFTQEQFEMLDIALQNDPGNPFYSLSLACSYFEQGKVSQGDKILHELLTDDTETRANLQRILTKVHPNRRDLSVSVFLETLRKGADGESQAARFCLKTALCALGQEDPFKDTKGLDQKYKF